MIVSVLIFCLIVIFPLLKSKKRTSPKQIKDLLIKDILEEISEGDNFSKGDFENKSIKELERFLTDYKKKL